MTHQCHRTEKFLRVDGYYQRFVEEFFRIVVPLTQLTRKDDKFNLGESQEKSFQELKNMSYIVMHQNWDYNAY